MIELVLFGLYPPWWAWVGFLLVVAVAGVLIVMKLRRSGYISIGKKVEINEMPMAFINDGEAKLRNNRFIGTGVKNNKNGKIDAEGNKFLRK